MNTVEEIQKIRLSNLKNVLNGIKNSRLYREKFQDIDTEINSLDDIRKFDLTTKQELREYSPKGNLAVDMKDVIGYHETSGTSGKSISTWLTRSDYQAWCDEVDSVALNFTKDDIVAVRYPYALSFPAHIIQEIIKREGATYVPLDSRGVVTPHSRVVNLLIDLNVTVIACIPLELIMLAEAAKMMGYQPREDFPSLRAFYTAGELLAKERKAQIEEIWGVPIYDNYGMTENGMIATMCGHGQLHIVEENFLVETLDPDTLAPVSEGEKGMLAITNLTLEANPLIRYSTGDLGVIRDGRSCGCNRTGAILEHHGRINDVICLNDTKITMTELQNAIIQVTKNKVSPLWMVSQNKKRILINLEEIGEPRDGLDIVSLEAEIKQILKCDCKIKMNGYGALFNRKKLLDMQLSIKPKYIADYSQSQGYPCTLDDLLRGYGTF